MMFMTFAAAVFLSASPPQDLPTNQLEQHADVVRQRTLDDALTTRNRTRPNAPDGAAARRSGETPAIEQTPERARACANRERFAAEHGRNHPQVRRLYALCAQAGY